MAPNCNFSSNNTDEAAFCSWQPIESWDRARSAPVHESIRIEPSAIPSFKEETFSDHSRHHAKPLRTEKESLKLILKDGINNRRSCFEALIMEGDPVAILRSGLQLGDTEALALSNSVLSKMKQDAWPAWEYLLEGNLKGETEYFVQSIVECPFFNTAQTQRYFERLARLGSPEINEMLLEYLTALDPDLNAESIEGILQRQIGN